MSPTRFLEITIISVILISSFILFYVEKKNHNPDYKKSWVSFYFSQADSPEKGVVAENHLGKNTNFMFCLIPDNDNILEPKDLTCDGKNSFDSEEKEIPEGASYNWQFSAPNEKNKYWIVMKYKDTVGQEQQKNLSYEIK